VPAVSELSFASDLGPISETLLAGDQYFAQ
jgi:hypothetical protein